jgi:hypothetical protein
MSKSIEEINNRNNYDYYSFHPINHNLYQYYYLKINIKKIKKIKIS